MISKIIYSVPRLVFSFFLVTTFLSGCTKDSTTNEESKPVANFIPQRDKKFSYLIETEGQPQGTATVSISGTRDSAGITLYNQQSIIETQGQSMTINNKLFDLKGKTYSELKVPDSWFTMVAMFNALPNSKVTKTELFGYPAFLTMENVIKQGSQLGIDGALIQGQLIEYISNGNSGSTKQEIVQSPGSGLVETIKVPAGTFVCAKFTYEMLTKITNKIGQNEYVGNGSEKIEVWMAHGIGMVKQLSDSRLVTLVPLPTGEVKEIVTGTRSLTTLQKIN